MSLYSCDVHGRRVSGALESAYPTVLRGGVRYFRKLRLCGDHMAALLGSESIGLTLVDDDSQIDVSPLCSACGQESHGLSSLDAVFVTAYRRSQERADYFAQLCRQCSDSFIGTYDLVID